MVPQAEVARMTDVPSGTPLSAADQQTTESAFVKTVTSGTCEVQSEDHQ